MKSPSPQPTRLVSLDAYRGAIMLLMASGGLGLGFHPAGVHVHGGGGPAVVAREPHGARAACRRPARPRALAVVRAGLAGSLPLFCLEPADGLGVHERPGSDRPRVPIPVPPG